MRIVFNLRDQDWETTKSLGILHVSTRILTALAALPGIERIDVLTNRSLTPQLKGLSTSKFCRLHWGQSPAPRAWARLLWDQWSVVRVCDQLQPDWLILPKGFSPLLLRPRARVSVFVHDNIFGYYQKHGGSPFPAGQSALFQAGLRRSARHASLIVTNSNFTRNEVIRDFAPVGRVVRIGAPTAPVAPASTPTRIPSGGILLLPTSTWPHKLTTQAIAWLQRWEDFTGNHRSVLGFGSLPPGCLWPNRPHWVHRGRLSEAELEDQLGPRTALIYFSAYEGYGMPPVEAAARGLRGIASDLPSLRETLPAQLLFNNSHYDSFHVTLTRALAIPPVAPLLVENAQEVAARWLAELRRG